MEKIKIVNFADFYEGKRTLFIGELELKKQEQTQVHSHDFYEVFVVSEGRFIHHYNGMDYTMIVSNAQFIKPEDQHFYHTTREDKEKNQLYNIAIEKKYFEHILHQLGIEDMEFFRVFSLDEKQLESFLWKCQQVERLGTRERQDYVLDLILRELILVAFGGASEGKEIPGWLVKASLDMEKEENLILGLPKMIELSNRSQAHLTRTFQQYYGCSPTEYINKLRLRYAARLLHESDLYVSVIAEKSGFNTLTYFNQLFKKYYHVGPVEYRKGKRVSLF